MEDELPITMSWKKGDFSQFGIASMKPGDTSVPSSTTTKSPSSGWRPIKVDAVFVALPR